MCRILSWTGQTCADGSDLNYQSTNGLYGLASGGWFGVGLGQCRQKYSWIPEAHNDFIFAIIGEELGLVGTLVVLVLFAHPRHRHLPRVVAQQDLFHRVLAGTIMVWLLGQAAVNMAVVTGLAPVVGIPLPFISYGGSALLMSLCAIGVVLSLARAQMAPACSPSGCSGTAPPHWPSRSGSTRGAQQGQAPAAGPAGKPPIRQARRRSPQPPKSPHESVIALMNTESLRCPSSSPAAEQPGTSARCWPSRTRSGRPAPACGSSPWAHPAAWKPGWSRPPGWSSPPSAASRSRAGPRWTCCGSPAGLPAP